VHSDNTQDRQWKRESSVAQVTAFEAASCEGTSQRGFAREHGVPRTTLQHWLERKRCLDASPSLVEFFESPDGLAFLHRLVIALQFVMSFVSGSGLRPVAMVIELAGLSAFVANSFGSRQKLGAEMESQVRAFAEEQRAKLSKMMAPKKITVCEDETFHPETCLVAIEPVSNFILLEAYSEGRDADSWTAALKEALQGLPVRVVQSTSDEGKGLLLHVRAGLGAHHSPDIFHVQQELTRATSVALAAQVRQAERAAAEAAAHTETKRAEAHAWALVEHGPGRPPTFQVPQAQSSQEKAEQTLNAARVRQERAHTAIRGIGTAYHPVDLKTGAPRTTAQVTADLEQHFGEIATVATEVSLPERCLKGIQKARRLVPALTCTLTFFHGEVQAQLGALNLPSEQAYAVENSLVPAAYMDRAASKATPADTRAPLRELAKRLRADAEMVLAGLSSEQRIAVERVTQDCADLFQRSSSCVEGRNGQLSLRHHSLHRITPARLQALTAVHNYFIHRPDGTTAAERFFGTAPADMFDWLLDHLEMPARPASNRRQSHAAHPSLN
jgi:hypothetical protein